jgi:hypothetical protein
MRERRGDDEAIATTTAVYGGEDTVQAIVLEEEIERASKEEGDDSIRNNEEDLLPTDADSVIRTFCYSYDITWREVAHSVACLIAAGLTGAGSWHCSYFNGASISFTGGNYGLWTLEDISGKCQLWDVLFFAYDIGVPLTAARVFSVTAQLLGLSLLTATLQAAHMNAVSWAIGMAFFALFLVSVSTTSIFNVWIVFWLSTYVLLILITRALFIHPVRRVISARGNKVIAWACLLCCSCSLLTLVVLKSDFCTCENITAQRLEGREPGNPCASECYLGAAGYLTVAASFFWLCTAGTVWKFGVTPLSVRRDIRPDDRYAYYRSSSILTRAAMAKRFAASVSQWIFNKKSPKLVVSRLTESSCSSVSQSPSLVLNEQLDENQAVDAEVNSEETADGDGGDGLCKSPEKKDDKVFLVQQATFDRIDEESDERSRCKKWCCDYRVTDRSRREKWAFWSFRIALGFLIGVYAFLVALLIGSRGENTTAAQAPDTSSNFITNIVCAYDPTNVTAPWKTFPHLDDAHAAGYVVAHCGQCGQCSNLLDTETYVKTRKTIAQSSKECGVVAVFRKFEELVDCLEDETGFTRPCTICWAENMENTRKQCLFTCLMTFFTGFMSEHNVAGSGNQGWLNQCLFCDEKMSGPAFIKCSGVARRRLGIVSEIERNPAEQCKNTDVDWINVDWDGLRN